MGWARAGSALWQAYSEVGHHQPNLLAAGLLQMDICTYYVMQPLTAEAVLVALKYNTSRQTACACKSGLADLRSGCLLLYFPHRLLQLLLRPARKSRA